MTSRTKKDTIGDLLAKKRKTVKPAKKSLKDLLSKKRITQKKRNDITTIKIKPIKKKGKATKVTISMLTNHKQILNEMNEFIYSLVEPYTRESFLASLNTYKIQLSTNKKVNNRIKFQLMRELGKMEGILSNLQDEKLIEWIATYQREKSNPSNNPTRIVYNDSGEEIGIKVQDIYQTLRNITQSSLETDTKNLIEAGIYMLPSVEDYQGGDPSTDEKLLKTIKTLLLKVKDSIGNTAKKEMINFLITNPEKFINVIFWIRENLGSDDEEVWEFVEELIPFTTGTTMQSQNPRTNINKSKTTYRWIDSAGQKKSTDIYSSVRSRRMNYSVSLQSLISELDRSSNLNRLHLLSDDAFKKIHDRVGDILTEARIPLEQAKAIVELNKQSNLFQEIVMYNQLKNIRKFSKKPQGDTEIELHKKIRAQLDSINFDHDTIITDNATITIVRITDINDEDDVYYSAFISAPGQEPQSMDVRTGQDVGKRHDRGIGIDIHGKIIRKMNMIQYSWIPSSVDELEEIPINEIHNQEKKDMMDTILRAIRGYMSTVLRKFMWNPINKNRYFVRVFREHYVKTFITEFVSNAIKSSQTIGDLLNKVSEFTIFFHMDPIPENRKNLFIITNITGSLNGRESGEYFRTSVINRRLTPESILANPIENKLPIIFHATNNADEMRALLNSGIQKEKQDIIISIFMILDPVKVKGLSGGFQEAVRLKSWASKSRLISGQYGLGTKYEPYWVEVPPTTIATDIKNKTVITHLSCNNTSENSVLYIETSIDPTTNQEIKYVYCFDLLTLYENLMNKNTKNIHSGKEFREDFIREIMSSVTAGKKELEDSNNMVNIEKQKASIIAIQQWFHKIHDKKPVKWDTNSRWATDFLLNIPEVKSEIERLGDIEKAGNKDIDDEAKKIIADMIAIEEMKEAAREKQAKAYKNGNGAHKPTIVGYSDSDDESDSEEDDNTELDIDGGEDGGEDGETWAEEEQFSDNESNSDSDAELVIKDDDDGENESNSDSDVELVIKDDDGDKDKICHHCKKQCESGFKTIIDNNTGITHVDVCVPCFEDMTL